LTTTIITVEILANNNYDMYTIDCVALSGIAISVTSYLLIERIKANPPRKYINKRRKKFNRL
jgi:hypothetical protein